MLLGVYITPPQPEVLAAPAARAGFKEAFLPDVAAGPAQGRSGGLGQWECSSESTGSLGSDFPEDVPERLQRFKGASRLTSKSLARLLGVSPVRLREWRRGVVPITVDFYLLLTVAEGIGLREGILMCPDRDMPGGADPEVGFDTIRSYLAQIGTTPK